MKIVKALLCLLLVSSACITFGSKPTEAASSFSDIGPNHRAYKEIMYLAQGQIINGSSNGTFAPNRNVTRAEATAFVGRALNLDGTKKSTAFKDVGSGNFASGYIDAATKKGIISGFADGTFKPDKLINRGEMAIMISRAFEYSYGNTLTGAENALKSRGIAQGLSNGSFGSEQNIIRADFAVFLARAVDYTLRLKPTITYSGEKYAITNDLNVRTGPSTKYKSIGTLQKHDKVSIGYTVGTWTFIKSGSLTGFVSSSYLSNEVASGGDDTPGDNPSDGSSDDAISSQTIIIDPGHGGKDSGAVGFGLKEKDVVLQTSLLVQKLLDKTPFNVKLTRDTDVFIELSDRVSFAKKNNGNTFVSIHANSATNESATGAETYYYSASRATNPNVADSKLLASSIQERLYVAMDMKDRKTKIGNLHVLRENTMPAALVELGFISNKSDNAKLASPTYRQKAANAVYLGILDYYKAKGYNVSSLYSVVNE
ncbi:MULTISPECIES: N-acetylmuramoyl-L-alanine amidase [Bacillus]|uniref:N-acetylmuramoyl-L-alanine amidase n=1 Tax=Bacillus TaxID=1386 RepID=UPI00031C10C4|nr:MULTISPECIES: N-acetylmuramoyl-L-alanine amidase [Bacillus]